MVEFAWELKILIREKRGREILTEIATTNLNHEFANDSMKDGIIIIPILGMSDKILYGFGRRIGKESNVDITHGGMNDGGCTHLDRSGLSLGTSGQIPWFLILHVPLGFGGPK